MNGAFLVLGFLLAATGDSNLERRVMSLSQQLRCLVCQNETIADSHADLAADLRKQIREMMIAGKSDSEITTFLTDRYGDFVLYRPPVTPKTYALWFGPFVLLAGGLYALYVFLRRWPRAMTLRSLSPQEHRKADDLLRSATDSCVAVYRDQFAEIESAFGTGDIGPEEYARDREELKRRLLDDSQDCPFVECMPLPKSEGDAHR